MGNFLDAAIIVLKKEQRALSAPDITEKARNLGILETKGKTPSDTMRSKLSTDILHKKDKSQFMRVSTGTYGLREWQEKPEFSEYLAARFIKNRLEEDVIVFPTRSLKKYISGNGLHTVPLKNGKDLLRECRSMPRLKAEEDFSFVQLISVFLVRYKDHYLTHKRTKRLPENRLHGSYSMFFGGHLNPEDIPALPFDIFDPQIGGQFLRRELSEELIIRAKDTPQIAYKGLLYDTSKEVSKQHLGVVYDVFLKSVDYDIGERGFLMDAKFETISEIENRLEDFENWSVIILKHEAQNGLCH